MRSVRPVVRTLTAVLLAGSCAVLVATTAAASVQQAPAVKQAPAKQVQQRSSGTSRADSHPLTLSIDSVSPQYATSAQTVTVHGTLSNHTGSAIPGLVVQLASYPSAFETPAEMTTYESGGSITLQAGAVTLDAMGVSDQLSGPLASGATVHWTASFNPVQDYGAFGITPGFGVYPLQVQAVTNASSEQATSQTLLPYWPGGDAAAKPTRLQVAWVWPLIDTPQQGACPQVLTTSSLAGSVAPGGRLSRLLATGAQWAARDDLTWAIDPALLSDATVMTHPYWTGGNSTCSGRTAHPASAAATTWLSALRAGTAGQPAFATPYADVDVSALSHAGLNAELTSAYQLGNIEASLVLPGTLDSRLPVAWPAGGTADAGVLNSLASDGGINTVVLNSDELPTSAPYYDNALAQTTTGDGTRMSVLLADSGITSILGSVSASDSPAAQFAATQDFLARTAMILAEAPDLSRSLVVAPPAGWAPSAAEATDLLRLTKDAPWLRATGLATLAGEARKVAAAKLRVRRVSKAELSGEYLEQIKSVNASVAQYENLLYKPPAATVSALDAAAAVTESAAWRGDGSYGGWLALTQLSDFFTSQEGLVRVIASKKVLLAGTTGTTPVSVHNGLKVPIQVLVEATPANSALKVGSGSFQRLLTVDPGMTPTVPLKMSSLLGTTDVRIQLFTRNGTPLTVPTASATMSVEVTRFGRTLLVTLAGVIGVLVLTTIVRLRRKRRAAGEHDGGGEPDEAKTESRAHAGGAG